MCTVFEVQGCLIPTVGLGTFQGDFGNSMVKQTVTAALQKGYRHIDTAAAYGNEKEVGEAIRERAVFHETKSSLRRSCKPEESDLIAWTRGLRDVYSAQTWHDPADVEEALDRSLRDLGLDYGRIAIPG